MLTRQRVLLAMLDKVGEPLSATKLVKLAFLLDREGGVGQLTNFYDFVPYKYGPFSFVLYREIEALRRNSYVSEEHDCWRLDDAMRDQGREQVSQLPTDLRERVAKIVSRYSNRQQRSLLRDVYARYPWYATKTELSDLAPAGAPRPKTCRVGIYTIGYERHSVDGFFDLLLREGIKAIADVRYNPVSRKYGFARSSLGGIADKLGIGYQHFPRLGIPGTERRALDNSASYQRLFDRYEAKIHASELVALNEITRFIRERPTVMVCVEQDVTCCHRSRLARMLAQMTKLAVTHF